MHVTIIRIKCEALRLAALEITRHASQKPRAQPLRQKTQSNQPPPAQIAHRGQPFPLHIARCETAVERRRDS